MADARGVPGAERAVINDRKLLEWILAERGHGEEFWRVLRVGVEDAAVVREALLGHGRSAAVETITPAHPRAGAGAAIWALAGPLAIGAREAWIRSVWEVPPAGPPRLVTAYPCSP